MKGWYRSAFVVVTLAACNRQPQPAPRPSGAPPQRIVSQTILSDELLWTLGPPVRARVVAISSLADDESYSAVAGVWPAAVRRAAGNSEALLAAAADLVIIADFTAVETQEMLAAASIHTLVLTGFSGFSDWRRNTTALSEAVGAADQGRALLARFEAELAERSVPSAATREVGVISWAAGNVAGSGTTFDDVATAAGLRNLAREHGIVGHKPVAVEQLVAWNPAMLVIPCEGTGIDACQRSVDTVRAQPGIAATAAAQHAGVVAIPPRILYSTGWAMLEAVTRLRSAAEARSGQDAP